MDIEYIGLSTWFSQIYLDINYGAGFTIIGEALLNYGPYVAPFILIILGYIITSTIYINKNDLENNPKQVLFAVAALLSWLPITRGTIISTSIIYSNFIHSNYLFWYLYTNITDSI